MQGIYLFSSYLQISATSDSELSSDVSLQRGPPCYHAYNSPPQHPVPINLSWFCRNPVHSSFTYYLTFLKERRRLLLLFKCLFTFIWKAERQRDRGRRRSSICRCIPQIPTIAWVGSGWSQETNLIWVFHKSDGIPRTSHHLLPSKVCISSKLEQKPRWNRKEPRHSEMRCGIQSSILATVRNFHPYYCYSFCSAGTGSLVQGTNQFKANR